MIGTTERSARSKQFATGGRAPFLVWPVAQARVLPDPSIRPRADACVGHDYFWLAGNHSFFGRRGNGHPVPRRAVPFNPARKTTRLCAHHRRRIHHGRALSSDVAGVDRCDCGRGDSDCVLGVGGTRARANPRGGRVGDPPSTAHFMAAGASGRGRVARGYRCGSCSRPPADGRYSESSRGSALSLAFVGGFSAATTRRACLGHSGLPSTRWITSPSLFMPKLRT